MKLLIFGATSAIAQAVARNFAADKADIVLIGRDATQLSAIADDLKVRGARDVQHIATSFATTMADIEGHESLVEKAIGLAGGVDAVLIAHGTLTDQKQAEADVKFMLDEMTTNALSFMSLLTILANQLEAQRSGCICVLSSVAGDRGRGSNYVYGSAKAAISAFTGGLRARLYKSGVSVVTVKPGFVDTPMTSHIKKGPLFAKPDAVGKRVYEAMLKGEDVVYVPWFWAPIMQIIRAVPERVFKRTKI